MEKILKHSNNLNIFSIHIYPSYWNTYMSESDSILRSIILLDYKLESHGYGVYRYKTCSDYSIVVIKKSSCKETFIDNIYYGGYHKLSNIPKNFIERCIVDFEKHKGSPSNLILIGNVNDNYYNQKSLFSPRKSLCI